MDKYLTFCFNDLSDEDKASFDLRTARTLWLIVTQDQIDQMNSLLPSYTRIGPVNLQDNSLVIGADVLTDCAENGTYFSIKDIVTTLIFCEGSPKVSD